MKKKIAIVEWFPRICGATDWALHLAAGGDCDLITFTRSGKPLKAFNRGEEWTVYKQRDAADVLNQYDLVVISDVVCFAPQTRDNPYYIDILYNLTVPWTSMYHGGTYPSKYDETLKLVLEAPSFTGVLMTTRLPEAKARLEHLSPYPIRFINHPFLPYDLARAPVRARSPKQRTRALMMTARIAVNKGQNAMISLLPYLNGNIHLYGYNAFGLPSIGWRLWELGQSLGYKVVVEAQLREDATQLTHPRAKRFYTGRWKFKAGRRTVEYHHGYVHLSQLDWTPWFHVSMANNDFKGTLEYVTLDAMALGLIPIVPEHATEYTRHVYEDTVVTVPYTRCNIWAKSEDVSQGAKGEITGNREMMINEFNACLNASDSTLQLMMQRGFAVLEKYHNPKKIFNKLVGGALK